ncbi:MAG: low molecular weight phosphotyrosine protein phosphatase [Solirubrobacterales bacterium]|nr:low molecular weight phosphotyrosine protein phosphatase [Solirubrobacterales bacterium]
MRLLFVCLGNICRSPTAEGVMRSVLAAEGLADRVSVDSAGTGSWHVGHAADARARAAAAQRGIELDSVARQVSAADFQDFDLLLAADRSNERDLLALAGADPARRAKVRLLRSYDPAAVAAGDLEVPDPYYDGGFEHVLDVIEAACKGLACAICQ